MICLDASQTGLIAVGDRTHESVANSTAAWIGVEVMNGQYQEGARYKRLERSLPPCLAAVIVTSHHFKTISMTEAERYLREAIDKLGIKVTELNLA